MTLHEIKKLLNPVHRTEPEDDFRILNSWTEFSKDRKKLEYLCYEIETIDPDSGKKTRVYKAICFARVERLPKAAKQSTSFMDMQTQVLSAAYEQGFNLVVIIANMIRPVPEGLLYLYGVQGVSDTVEKAKNRAHRDYNAFIRTLMGTFRVLHIRTITSEEGIWLENKMYNMKYMTAVRGIPKARTEGEDMGNKGIGGANLNPDSQGTLEEIITAMADYEYVIEVLSTPVYMKTLAAWSSQTEKRMTEWYGQLQGTKNLSFNLSIPMTYMTSTGSSEGWSKNYTDSDSVSYTNGSSYNTGYSENVGHSLSTSLGESFGTTRGSSVTDSVGTSYSTSHGTSVGQNVSQSTGYSTGSSHGYSHSVAQGQTIGYTQGVTKGTSQGISISTGQGTSASTSLSNGKGVSIGSSLGESTTTSTGTGVSHSTSSSTGTSQSVGSSTGQSLSNSYSTNSGTSTTLSHSTGTNESHSYGTNSSTSSGGSSSHTSGDTNGNTNTMSRTSGGSKGTSTSNSSGGGNSHTDGTSINGSVSVSVPYSKSVSGSVGGSTSNSDTKSTNYNDGSGTTRTSSWGTSTSNSNSKSHSESDSTSSSWSTSAGSSESYSAGKSESYSVGNGKSYSEGFGSSYGQTSSLSYSNGQSTSSGETSGTSSSSSSSHGTTSGSSYSETSNNSVGQTAGTSTSISISKNQGTTYSSSMSQSASQSYTLSDGETWGTSSSESYSQSKGSSTSESDSVSNGTSSSHSVGTSEGSSYTQTASNGTGESWGESNSVSTGQSFGQSTGKSTGSSVGSTGTFTSGTSGSMGLGPSIGYSKSYQWMDQQVKDILELLEFQNERIKKALRGAGMLYTYVYIACPDMDALATAQAAAKSTWQNEYALTNPLQVLDLSPEEQQHLLYHFTAFSADVTRENVAGSSVYKYATVLLPGEAVAYTHLPRVSEGGIDTNVNDIPKFRVPGLMKGNIYMGTQLNSERYTFFNGYRTQFDYRINIDELMHGLFTGASRSGKTVAAMRFISELANSRRTATGKRLRIVIMDPKQDWRGIARFVEPERFRFYSMGNTSFRPINLNPCKIPYGCEPQHWIDGIVNIYCRAYGLLERGKQMISDALYDLYVEAGVFNEQDMAISPDWKAEVSKRSAKVTFHKLYKSIQTKYVDVTGTSPGKKGGNDTIDAYSRLLERLSCFNRSYSIEYRLFSAEEATTPGATAFEDPESVGTGYGVDELIGADDVTVFESHGLESTFASFIFGVITSGFYKVAKGIEKGYLNPSQYETVLVIEEANKVLTGNDAAGTGGSGGGNVSLSGQSEFEEILDQSAGYGLFIIAITQRISNMPPSMLANCGMLFMGKIYQEDAEIGCKMIGRDPRIDDKDVVKWLPVSPTGWFICRSNRGYNFLDAEPVLVQIEPLNNAAISNAELEEILVRKEVYETLRKTAAA